MNARTCRAGLLLLLSGAAAYVLVRLGTGPLASPARWSPTAVERWAVERGTVVVAMTGARLLAIAIAAYLCLLSMMHIAASIGRTRWLDWIATRLTPRVMRSALGLGLAPALLATTAGSALADTTQDDAPVMVQVDDRADDPPVMHFQGAASTPVSSTTTRIVTPGTTTQRVVHHAPALTPPVDTWTVARGDHFWSISAETIFDRTGTRPTAAETARYWRRLIEANRDRLVDPDNADLIYAGQEFVLPPL